jgi:hypothetical protein
MKQSIAVMGGRTALSVKRTALSVKRAALSAKKTAQIQLNYDGLKHLIDTPE